MRSPVKFNAQQGIILLSFSLALGFLSVILSCALFGNWTPLLVAAIWTLAPAPNAIFARCSGVDDFSADYSSGALDFGHFLTSMFVVTGVSLPLVLAHAEILHPVAAYMAIGGGALVYGTIVTYSRFFAQQNDTF